jgi:6,7-dimethyl-8-ribityllumazine synthase
MTFIEGALDARGLRIAIVAARFNSFVVARLVEGAIDAARRAGASDDAITLIHVPGSWEIPVTVRALIARGGYDAILCLGAVVRGETPHFDYVAAESARGIAQAASDSGVPVMNGVLTTNTLEQAIDRAGGKAGNKGFDAAMAAIEMAHVLRRIRA